MDIQLKSQLQDEKLWKDSLVKIFKNKKYIQNVQIFDRACCPHNLSFSGSTIWWLLSGRWLWWLSGRIWSWCVNKIIKIVTRSAKIIFLIIKVDLVVQVSVAQVQTQQLHRNLLEVVSHSAGSGDHQLMLTREAVHLALDDKFL